MNSVYERLTDCLKSVESDNENWIWVTGYKGMDKDMKCKNDFQYEIGKKYDMPEDEAVITCSSGFHMCLELMDVFDYVPIQDRNRFFEVRALVRESDVRKYNDINYPYGLFGSKNNKLAAKSIEIVRELTIDEILEPHSEANEWSFATKQTAITVDFSTARKIHRTSVLVKLGYANPLAEYIVNDRNSEGGYELAVALDSQPGISMDTKINAIFSHI